MRRRYATADVFTSTPLTGNPVAVVFDAGGLTVAQMQALAAEFNYVETTFVLSPHDPAHTAQVRIFTPVRELPFAGHPTLGTAFLLARERAMAGEPALPNFIFEEGAGLVSVDLRLEGAEVVGADMLSPAPLTRHARLAPHAPEVVSVGLPFLDMELVSRAALRRARPDPAAFAAALPLDGANAVYAYTRDGADETCDLHSRMFTARMVEDPATGSATAALTALLSHLRGGDEVRLRTRQGEDMGRPGLLDTRSAAQAGAIRAHVGGRCAAMFHGEFELG